MALENIPALKTSQSLTQSSQKPSAARMAAAGKAVKALLRGRPDTGSEPPDWTVGITETLSYLDDDQLAALTHPTTGLQTKLRFLPTPADVFGFLEEHRKREEQFKPASTSYHKFSPAVQERLSESDIERRKRLVREALGYDPQHRNSRAAPPAFKAVDIRGFRSSADLKTPPAPVSDELYNMLYDQGYLQTLKQEPAA